MPTYETVFLFKKLERPALKTILKRSIENLFQLGATVRKIENLGLMKTPFGIRAKGQVHKEAHYFIFNFDLALNQLPAFTDIFKREKDIVMARNFIQHRTPGGSISVPEVPECTLYLDMLPPPYRPSVLELQKHMTKEQKKREKRKFKFNTGLNFDPLRP